MSTPPNTVRVKSLSTWAHFFHPTTGIFRLPSAHGASIEHLEIDLRYVDESCLVADANVVFLPNVCRLTLRGGEYCQEDERMEALTEVLFAINPVEVHWLHASDKVDEQFSFSTHLVHHAIIAAGQQWHALRKLVVQGGFPCPNLTPPTPFAVTPATTPCPSPGPRQRFSSIPALSTTKPKSADNRAEQEERKRIAEYALKPRFEYAFGSWGAEELRWRLDGRYTSVAILSILSNLFRALARGFLSDSIQVPSLLAIGPLPVGLVEDVQKLVHDLEPEVIAHLQDTVFIATSNETKFARPFNNEVLEIDDRTRLTRRMKAEMLLAGRDGAEAEMVDLAVLCNDAKIASPHPSSSHISSDEESGDELDAVTPELLESVMLERPVQIGLKKEKEHDLSA